MRLMVMVTNGAGGGGGSGYISPATIVSQQSGQNDDYARVVILKT